MPGFPFNFVIMIVLIVVIGGILRKWLDTRGAAGDARLERENEELREQMEAMRERLHVLERITVEKENSLAREIDDLRKD